MKVLILGKNGMLGSCFLKSLAGREDFEMYAFARGDLDVTDSAALRNVFSEISPDFVINCTGYTAVDDCETDRDTAFKVNAEAPGIIADICKKEKASLVHFSTDYIFDGKKKDGYKEDDEPNPVNVYGESKLQGEKNVMEHTDDYHIVRTSWLFGRNGKNFVDTMISLARDKKELNVVGNQIGSPTYTQDLVEAVITDFLAPHLVNLDRHHEYVYSEATNSAGPIIDSGIYHITNSNVCSWYQFAKKIFELSGIDVQVNEVGSDTFPRPAKRPDYSILLNTKLEHLRSWEKALEVYIGLHHKR